MLPGCSDLQQCDTKLHGDVGLDVYKETGVRKAGSRLYGRDGHNLVITLIRLRESCQLKEVADAQKSQSLEVHMITLITQYEVPRAHFDSRVLFSGEKN